VGTFAPGGADRDVLKEHFMLTALSVKISLDSCAAPRQPRRPSNTRRHGRGREHPEPISVTNEELYQLALVQKVPFHRVSSARVAAATRPARRPG
jgi:hypothetical protein